MKKNDKLKKHHFWILLGLVPLFVMIAVITITSSVGGAYDDRLKDISKSETALKGKIAKSTALLDKLDLVNEEAKKKKINLWEDNWKLQKDLFTWPKSEKLNPINGMDLKFGATIPDDNFAYEDFKNPEVYLSQFSTAAFKTTKLPPPGTVGMADTIAPTQFNGGWESILRHVTNWGTAALTSEQLWLVMEDVWVQRSMLAAVRSVNEQMAEFHRVKYEKNGTVIDDPAPKSPVHDPIRRRFESRTWAIELEITDVNNKKVLTGRLINLTDRLQVMGLNNTLILNVWLQKGSDIPPFEFRIGGEYLPGRGTMKTVKVKDNNGKETGETKAVPANELEIVPTDDHILPLSLNGAELEIVKVEQVFDARTVPIRRIDALALGFKDNRHAPSQLVIPDFKKWKTEAEAEAAAATSASSSSGTSGPGSSGGMPGAGPAPGGVVGMGGPGTGPGTGTGAAAGGALFGGGPIESVINGNKKRYIQITPQVRRMPVAIDVVVDQDYMQDVLLAFANSPLRFQITQVSWNRFRGTLEGLGTGGSTGNGSSDYVLSGSGTSGSEFRQGPDTDVRPGKMRPGIGKMPGSGSGMPLVGGKLPGSGVLPPSGVPGSPSSPMSGYNPYGSQGAGNLTTVSESQLTSGLIELRIYGVISLYEKYEKAPPEGTATDPGTKEKEPPTVKSKDKEPKDKEPKEKGKDKEPMPKEPMMPETKTPKMRRRIR